MLPWQRAWYAPPVAALGGSVFTPLSLFSGGGQGVWYDPSDLSSMFQDSAGVTPSAVDSPVGKIFDKSGNANHAVQATASARPILRQSGSKYWLEFDGTNDILLSLFTTTQPLDRVSAIQQVSWTSNDYIFDGGTTLAAALLQTSSTPQIWLYSGAFVNGGSAAAVGSDVTLVERHNGASSRLGINMESYVTGNAGSTVGGGLAIGGVHSGSSFSNIRLYGLVQISRALTDAEVSNARGYMAYKIDYRRTYVSEGDSITLGQFVTASYAALFVPNSTKAIFYKNEATNSAKLATWKSRAATVDLHINGVLSNVLSVLPGNDIFVGYSDDGGSRTTWLTDFAGYLDARREAGWKVVLCTILPRTTAGFNTERNIVNPILRTWVGSHCDAICDFAADATVGTDAAASDTGLYSDGTHPTDSAQATLETIFRPVINAL